MSVFNTEVRHNPASAQDGTNPKIRQSRRGELIVPDWYFQVAAEGRIFYAGDELEATFNDGQAAILDTTPTYVLKSPAGTYIVPISIDLELTTEGGAAPLVDIVYIQGDSPITTQGTTIVAYNARGGSSVRASKAIHQLNPTVTALAADNVILFGGRNIPDNLITAGLADTVDHGVGLTDMATFRWTPPAPLLMIDGAQISVYFGTGTTDSKWRSLFVWAEFDSSDVI